MIGWYVHHQGRGHLARAQSVLAQLNTPARLLTSLPAAGALQLSLDTDVEAPAPAPSGLHWAPLGSAGLRGRMAAISAWLETERPSLVVVDVSVEVALLVRLHGVRVVYVRQHGHRGDPPHRLAYDASEALLAPYPEWLEQSGVPRAVRRKTFYAGGFSRFDGRALPPPQPGPRQRPRVLFITGAGGDTQLDTDAIAAACPWYEIQVAGRGAWAQDPWPLLAEADVVVAAAGHNAVMEAAAARRPLICVPEARPFGEQVEKARALEREHMGVFADPATPPAHWGELIEQARRLGGERLAKLNDGGGAARAAAWLDGLAASSGRELGRGRFPQQRKPVVVPIDQARLRERSQPAAHRP